MPTPGAVGLIIETIAQARGDHTSSASTSAAPRPTSSPSSRSVFNRTVSANLGHVATRSRTCWPRPGCANILRWVPFPVDEVRPAQPDQEQDDPPDDDSRRRSRSWSSSRRSRARRCAWRSSSTRRWPSGSRACSRSAPSPTPSSRRQSGATLVNLADLDLLVGSGGVLSHAPRRVQSAFMMIDAFLPECVTELAVDSIFMMPQLGRARRPCTSRRRRRCSTATA